MRSIKIVVSIALVFVLLAVCASSVFAVSLYVDGDYTYADIDSYNVALYAYDGDDPVLVVPEDFYGRYVSQIYEYAFEENTAITGIDFSQNNNRLRSINTKAFNECTELGGDLNIPSSVRTLGFAAFQGCVSLESLTVNYGISEIPAQCFNRCSGLTKVTLAPSVESIENLAFAYCTSLESVYLPRSVTYISTSAFNGSHPVLYVYYDTYSYRFALSYGFSYVVLDPENIPQDPTEPPTTLPTEPPTEAPLGYLLGDTDNDDNVDVVDATWVQRAVAEMDVAPVQATLMQGNVDGDDLLTVIDATFIMRYTVNIATPYAIGERVVNS